MREFLNRLKCGNNFVCHTIVEKFYVMSQGKTKCDESNIYSYYQLYRLNIGFSSSTNQICRIVHFINKPTYSLALAQPNQPITVIKKIHTSKYRPKQACEFQLIDQRLLIIGKSLSLLTTKHFPNWQHAKQT